MRKVWKIKKKIHIHFPISQFFFHNDWRYVLDCVIDLSSMIKSFIDLTFGIRATGYDFCLGLKEKKKSF